MHAVVLAGGYATRLWPVTKNRPKMLLPIGETTVVDRILRELEYDDRIDEVYVSTNERFADEFAAHVEDTGYEKPRLSVEDTSAEEEKFGVVGALAQLVDREGIADEDLLVVAGDNLISFDLAEFVDYFQEQGVPTLAAYEVGSYDRASSYGVVDLDGERVVDFQEKPDNPASTLCSIACYAFPAEAIRFDEYLAGDNNPDEPGWFIQWLVDNVAVAAFSFDEAWFDIGTPQSYLDAVAWELDGENLVAQSATVENCILESNVHILPGAEVVDSTVDGSVIFPESVVRDCELRTSIIDRETRIENLDLAGAVIGAHTVIANSE